MSQTNANQQHGSQEAEDRKLQENIAGIKKKILVLSGKGGVGKSTVAANIAYELANKGFNVGLLDVDFHGPSIPRLMGLVGQKCYGDEVQMLPVAASKNLRVMSLAFMLEDNSQAVVWRGPMKYTVIKKLLGETVWGELDYLVVDSPPGTGDEPLSVAQLVGAGAGAVIVTTPQTLAVEDVRRCVKFCEQLFLPVWGLVENMSGFVCPHCDEKVDIFGSGGGQCLASENNIDLLGKIPIDAAIAAGGDGGDSIANSSPTKAVRDAVDGIIDKLIEKTNMSLPDNK